MLSADCYLDGVVCLLGDVVSRRRHMKDPRGVRRGNRRGDARHRSTRKEEKEGCERSRRKREGGTDERSTKTAQAHKHTVEKPKASGQQ
jgi:hypothetical protein